MSFHAKPRGGRQQAAIAKNADGLGVPGACQFRRVAHGPQEFHTAGETGRLLTRQGRRNSVALGQQPANLPRLPLGGLVIGEAPQLAASARVIADLEGRVPVAIHGAGAAVSSPRHCRRGPFRSCVWGVSSLKTSSKRRHKSYQIVTIPRIIGYSVHFELFRTNNPHPLVNRLTADRPPSRRRGQSLGALAPQVTGGDTISTRRRDHFGEAKARRAATAMSAWAASAEGRSRCVPLRRHQAVHRGATPLDARSEDRQARLPFDQVSRMGR